MIAHFSSQPYSQQDMKPAISKHVYLLQEVRSLPRVHFDYDGQRVDSYKNTAGFIEFCIRKTIHFTMYGILGLLMLTNLAGAGWRGRKMYLAGVLVVLAIASMDEFNQLSTPGRAGRVNDVVLDCCGGIFFAWLRWLKTRKA